jgi:DNA invertase Pin-like site-specific DNA recombinase
MPRIGYARVSTSSQDLDIQKTKLKEAGCEIVRAGDGAGVSYATSPPHRDFACRRGFRRILLTFLPS